jgi:hypothetical protein
MLPKFKYFFLLLQGTEHYVGNSDYGDNNDDYDDNGDDDVTDGAVGGGYPNRVLSVPSFHSDTVRRPLENRPDFATRGGHGDGSGSSGLPRPNVTDRDQEKGEGATALDNSSASFGADDSSCSTLAQHTYTRLSSMQNSSSDSTLVQNRKVSELLLLCNSFSYTKLKYTMIQSDIKTAC